MAGHDRGDVKTLQTRNASLRYVREGAGPPVLLVQGVGVVGEGWRPQIRGLRDRYTVVAFDNRGIGASTFTSGALTVDDMIEDALAIADAEGFDRFHVAGHSLGGLIAQGLALGARARILSLALLCTFVRGRQAARLTPGIVWMGLRTRLGTRAMRRRAFMQLVMPDPYLRDQDEAALGAELTGLFGRDLAEQPPIVMQQLRATARYDVSERLPELAGIPTLAVSATHDRIALPRYGQAIVAAIPGARYVEIAEAGHGVTIQCANRINGLLAEHFAAAESARV